MEKKLGNRMPKTWDNGERNDCTSNLFCQLVFTVSPSCHILMFPNDSFEQNTKSPQFEQLGFFLLGRRGEGEAFFMPILCGSLCALGGCLEVGLVFYFSEEPPISIQINKLELK